MLTSRIIPCLDVRDGRVVKGVKFADIRDAGDPVAQATRYERTGADEIVILDISATPSGKSTAVQTVEAVRQAISIPLTVGGGVRTLDDALMLLDAGADKVSVNSAAVTNPELISDLQQRVGTQCVVLAIDAMRRDQRADSWEVVTRSGSNRTGLEVSEWADKAVSMGAGEVLLTSFDRDGTHSGYDLSLIRSVRDVCSVPIIASGGGSTSEHMHQALDAGASAVLAASIFHDQHTTPDELKEQLALNGIQVRL
ncbi:MAG: imidazole glycerol phosphate synthase subunit HisF [Phycisphaerales bacterium]